MHKATATPLTQLKERLAKMSSSNAHMCYGRRCAAHHNSWYMWKAGTAK